MNRIALLCTALVFAAASAEAAPKIAPLPKSAWSAQQKAVAAQFSKGPSGNALATFIRFPQLVRGTYPLAGYLMADSTITPRQRELLTLRTAWNCSSQYMWSYDVPRAKAAGISDAEIARIAQGPDAADWSPLEAALLRAADDLHKDSFISGPAWAVMAKALRRDQLVDATFTVTDMMQFAALYNSIGIEPDAGNSARLPSMAPHPPVGKRWHQALGTARIPQIAPKDFTDDIYRVFDPKRTGKEINRLYITYAHSKGLFEPRQIQSEHIRTHTSITDREKDMAILRITHQAMGDFPYSVHVAGARKGKEMTDAEITRLTKPGTAGWSDKESSLIKATDEIFAYDKVSDETWKALKAHYSDQQILDIMVSGSGYWMVGMTGSTFAVQLPDGSERMPGTNRP